MSKARLWPVDSQTYHADTSSISHSGLDLVIEDPALYHFQKLSGQYVPKDEQYFRDGTALDEALLNGGEIGANIVVIPDEVLSAGGTKSGSAWRQFAAEHQGKTLVKKDDPLLFQARAVMNHPIARALLESDYRAQETIVWHDDEFGVDRRVRFDFIRKGNDLIADLKTTRSGASPKECADAAAKFGYHRQQPFYKDGAEALYGVRPDFVFIFVAKDPPYRVEVITLDEEFEQIGDAQNKRGLAKYAECLRTGKWLPETQNDVVVVPPPGWLRHQGEWEFSNG